MKIGFLGLLTLIFITLKLCSVIDWSWWWVLSPLILSLSLIFIGIIFAVIAGVAESKVNRDLRKLGLK